MRASERRQQCRRCTQTCVRHECNTLTNSRAHPRTARTFHRLGPGSTGAPRYHLRPAHRPARFRAAIPARLLQPRFPRHPAILTPILPRMPRCIWSPAGSLSIVRCSIRRPATRRQRRADYVLSLAPRQELGFVKAGELRGGAIIFTIGNAASAWRVRCQLPPAARSPSTSYTIAAGSPSRKISPITCSSVRYRRGNWRFSRRNSSGILLLKGGPT